jgi:hypothetical protein
MLVVGEKDKALLLPWCSPPTLAVAHMHFNNMLPGFSILDQQ